MNKDAKKRAQLGMPQGTAANKLRKIIMFDLVCKLKLNTCYQCQSSIDTVEELSIEHKEPYLDSADPIQKYFDLGNIAFSHHSCNSGARRNTRIVNHGTSTMYINYKCRCEECLRYRSDRYAEFKN